MVIVEEQKEAEAVELRAQENAEELQAEARKEAEKGLEATQQRAEEMLQSAEEWREQARMLACTFVIRGVVKVKSSLVSGGYSWGWGNVLDVIFVIDLHDIGAGHATARAGARVLGEAS